MIIDFFFFEEKPVGMIIDFKKTKVWWADGSAHARTGKLLKENP
jgi:hypothetical protein